MEEEYVDNLYSMGQNILYFTGSLLGTQIIMWLAGKLVKDDEKRNKFKSSGYNIIFSVLFLWFNTSLGIILLVFNVLVVLFGIRFTLLKDKKISDWGTGIILVLTTVLNIISGEYDKQWEFAVLGIAWLLFTVVFQNEKIWKFTRMGLFTLLSMVSGVVIYLVGYNYQFETAHILTAEYTTTMDGMSADVSGYATANAKVRTYLDGEEVKPAEESDEDGYFSFEANKPGKWVVKVTKNGKTDSDYTIVRPSKKYKDKKAKKIKEKFANAFAQMADSLEEIGVDEYNRWSDADASGTGGSVNDLIAQVQKEHGTDSTVAMLGKYNLNDYLKQLKNLESTDYDTYSDYYSDMLSYYRTVMNPPAGYKDNFGDKFDDLRDKITNDFDEMGR